MAKTYYLGNNADAISGVNFTNEFRAETFVSSVSFSGSVTTSTQNIFAYWTPPNQPGTTTWPLPTVSDPYTVTLDVSAFGSAVSLSDGLSTFYRFTSGGIPAGSANANDSSWDSNVGTGLKTLSLTQGTGFGTATATDRLGVGVVIATSNTMMDNNYTFVTNSNTTLVGPWATGPASQNASPALIQESTLYNPTFQLGSISASPSLISSSAIFDPSIGRGLPIGLISDGTILAPTVVPGSVAVTPGLISDSAIFSFVIPSLSSSLDIDLISESAVYSPTAVVGSVNVTPGLIADSAVYSFTLSATKNLPIGLIQNSAIFQPTLTVGSVNVVVGLIQESTVYSPGVAVGATSVSPSLISDSTVFAPVLQSSINLALALIEESVVFEPSVLGSAQTVSTELIGEAVVLSPDIAPGSVAIAPDLISSSEIYDPGLSQITYVALSRIGGTTPFTPVLVQRQILPVELIQSSTLYEPSVAPQPVQVTATLLSSTTVFAPTLSQVQVGLGEVTISAARLNGASVSHTVISSSSSYAVMDVEVSHRLTGES